MVEDLLIVVTIVILSIAVLFIIDITKPEKKKMKDNELPIESRLFVKDHLTDFEKLLQAIGLIKELKKKLDAYSQDETVKNLKIELGKANTYIQELEAKVAELEKLAALSREENKAIKREVKATEMYKTQQATITRLEKDIHRVRTDRDILIARLVNDKH